MEPKNNPFAWPFSKMRQTMIDDADLMISEAEELTDDPAVSPYLPSVEKRYRRAAKLYERSADLYSRAGLGLMAQASWQDASECWFRLGDEKNVKKCELRASAIHVYYDEEE